VPILVLAIVASFAAGLFIGKSGKSSAENIGLAQNQELGKPEAVNFSLFWDVWNKVENEYVGRSKLDAEKMLYGAISGMLRALNDPYTLFLPPAESKKFQDDMRGDFEGIGAEIGLRKDVLTIIAPIEGTPAQRAGLQPQDIVLKINDTSTDNLNLDEAVNLIRGPKGTTVRLLVMRNDWKEPKEFAIVRDKINIPILKLEMKDSNIAYIRLYEFTENSPDEFDKAAKQVLKSNAKGVILDLRNNPGGYLEAAVNIAGWFLKSGNVVAIEDFGNGQKTEYRSKGNGSLGDRSVIVLVNQGSASASEILAGALRDDKQSKLVGQKTFGKGSVQQLDNLANGASLKITIAKWLTPSGQSIMNEGLEPDVKVEITDDDINNGRDPQLEKALEMLR
jgi:carboxyl-terminal processing protease